MRSGNQDAAGLFPGKETRLFAIPFIHIKMIILPRQARDKHRESTQKRTRFCRHVPRNGEVEPEEEKGREAGAFQHLTCAAASAAAGCRCKTAGGLECRLVFDLQNSRSCVVFSPNADAAECLRRHVGRTERAPAGVVGGGSKPMGACHCRTVLSCPVVSCPVLSCRAVPCRGLLCPALSCPVVSCCVLSCRAVPCRGLLCPALSCPVVPYRGLLCPALPCPALSCPALPCPVLLCPALPCPVLSCRVVSPHIYACAYLCLSACLTDCLSIGVRACNRLRCCNLSYGRAQAAA
eukprot:COSAG06_NODE_1481_length_9319_cov_264.596963_9_plen_293_part_00